MFWLIDIESGKVTGWANDVDTLSRMLANDQKVFTVREETDDCLTKGFVAVVDEDDGWKGIAITRNWEFSVEHVTDDSKTVKVTCDSWYDALKA